MPQRNDVPPDDHELTLSEALNETLEFVKEHNFYTCRECGQGCAVKTSVDVEGPLFPCTCGAHSWKNIEEKESIQ